MLSIMPIAPPESFAVALDAAIEQSGLSLERLQHHLAERGVRMSRSALSYWRRGRSQPEREASLHAVQHLEQVLDLSPGTLTSRLGPRAPRGRWLGRPLSTIERRRLWPELRPLSATLKPPPDGQVTFWSVHDFIVLDDDGCERLARTHLVAEAAYDGVDRVMIYHQAEGPLTGPVRLRSMGTARVGRVCTDEDTGMLAAELLLDRVLARGDVVAVEYEISLPSGTPSTEFGRRFTRAGPEYVCQVHFGQHVPKHVYAYERRVPGGPRRRGAVLRPGASHSVTFATRDAGPGITGVAWTP